MQTITKGENAPPKSFTALDDETVEIIATCKSDENASVRYLFNVGLDFADCPPSEILELAAKTVWINGMQRPFRETAPHAQEALGDEWERDGFSVRTWLDRERKSAAKATPAEKVGKMSEEEKEMYRALLAE